MCTQKLSLGTALLSTLLFAASQFAPIAAAELPIPIRPPAKHRQVKLALKEAKGAKAIPRPVSGAVPIARGELKNPKRVRLLDPAGKPVPVQTRITGYWPEGTVKWLLLDFVVSANGPTEYTIEYGTDVPALPGTGAIAAEKNGKIVIDTGAIKVEFSDKASAGIEKLWLGKQLMLGDEKAAASQEFTYIHTKDPGFRLRPELIIPKAAKAPTIDGKLDDAVWKEAGLVTELVGNYVNEPAPLPTEVRALYDEKNLYFGVVCHKLAKDITKIVEAQKGGAKGGLWSQDVFEFFIDADGDEIDYNQVFLNAVGVTGGTYIVSLGKTKRNIKPDVEYKVSVQGNAWVGEARIPFATLANLQNTKFVEGHRLGLFFGREIHNGAETLSYSWNATYGQWHVPTRFGKAYLGTKPAAALAEDEKKKAWETSGTPIDMEPLLPSSLNKAYCLEVPAAHAAPTIDGKIEAAEWAKSARCELRREDDKKPDRKTEVYVKADASKQEFPAYRFNAFGDGRMTNRPLSPTQAGERRN